MAFNLGELIKQGTVPNLGTTREVIEYIDLALIDDDPRNFYQLSGLDELAANIELVGLQQPIRVRTNPDDPTRVIIVSGHRRCSAIRKLSEDDPERWKQVPCIRERDSESPALQELRLIYANSDTRKMSSADISKQVERVEELLYQLQEEGYSFPGRMRDHVAQACQVSKSKLSRLKVIRDHLSSDWLPHYEKDEINESVAYALAQQPEEYQQKIYQKQMEKDTKLTYLVSSTVDVRAGYLDKLSKIECDRCGGTACQNQDAKWNKITSQNYYYGRCDSICCDNCGDLASCKYACPLLADKAKKLKAENREARRQEKLKQENKDAPKIRLLSDLWIRFGVARSAAGKSVQEFKKAIDIYYSKGDEKEFVEKEGAWKITTGTSLPYGYAFSYTEAKRLIDTADMFGCSLDYLFCRTDNPTWPPISDPLTEEPPKQSADPDNGPSGQLVFAGWMPGGTTPCAPCDVVAVFDMGEGKKNKMFARWDGYEFRFKAKGAKIDMQPIKWMVLPPEED